MPEFLSLRPACTGCRCVPHATGREVFISLWKSCEKACRDGLLAHCLVFMAASPALGLKGVCQRVTIPFIGDQVLASRAVQIPVLSVESCQSSGVTELPIERRWWTAGPFRSRWRCLDLKVPTTVQVADTDSDVVRGIEVRLISTAWIKTSQFRVRSRRR